MVYAVAFSPHGRLLACASQEATITLWDLTDHNCPVVSVTLRGHRRAVQGLAFSPDGHLLASARPRQDRQAVGSEL